MSSLERFGDNGRAGSVLFEIAPLHATMVRVPLRIVAFNEVLARLVYRYIRGGTHDVTVRPSCIIDYIVRLSGYVGGSFQHFRFHFRDLPGAPADHIDVLAPSPDIAFEVFKAAQAERAARCYQHEYIGVVDHVLA